MNEVKLKGVFLKELFKGRITKVCLFYDEKAGMVVIGVDIDEEITFKKDCLINVSLEGRVKQSNKGMVMYENKLVLQECNYIAGVEK